MKKIILFGGAVALIAGAFAFTSSPSKLFEPKPYCVTMRDAAKGRMVKITINASGGVNDARRKAESMYPNLKYHGMSIGACK